MKLTYDALADALYLELESNTVARSQRINFNVSLDLSSEGEVIGIEVLNVRKRGLDPDELGAQTSASASQTRPDTEAIEAERAKRRAARQREKVS